MTRKLSILSLAFATCITFLIASAALAIEVQAIAGAGPSTKIVQSFITEFNKNPATEGYQFEVPPKSAKHAGGIRCSNINLFGRTGRPLHKTERAMNKDEIILAKVPIAFVIGKKAGVDTISLKQLEQVFTGQITNWKDLGGVDSEIILVGREQSEALFLELKASYPFFKKAKFDAVVQKDGHVINFIRSPRGQYGLAFGAKPNFSEFKTVVVPGFNAGVRLGLVFDLKNRDHAVIKAAQEFAKSTVWRELVAGEGMFVAN